MPLLFIARIGQAVSGTTLWIVGFATLADTVGVEHMGVTVGIITSFASAGTFAGPMIAGVLLEKVGYWHAWASAIAVVRQLVLCAKPEAVAVLIFERAIASS